MDSDSSSKFIGSLTKFLQSLCNGYVEFEDGVELIGHIYLSVDTGKKGKKIDYVLNEKVCKNDNSVTFISNSFHAENPKDNKKDDDISDSGDGPPKSTNTGTMPSKGSRPDGSQRPQAGSKRPGSPLSVKGQTQRRPSSPTQRRLGKSVSSPSSRNVPSSPSSSSQDNIPSPSMSKRSRTDFGQPLSNQSDSVGAEESDIPSLNPTQDFANFLGSLTSDNKSPRTKPDPDADVTFIKEEFGSEPSSCAQAGGSGNSGKLFSFAVFYYTCSIFSLS